MMKIKVSFDGKEIERTVYTKRNGDKYIKHHNEEWLLHPRTNEIMHHMTTNTASAMYDRREYIDSRMYHLDKLPPQTTALVGSALNTLNDWYKKEESFLDKHYDVDSYELNAWLDHAFDTLKKERN